MTISIAGLTNGIASQGIKSPGEYHQTSQAGGRSFESVLRGGGDQLQEQTSHAPSRTQTRQVPATEQEPVRVEMLDARSRQELTRLVLNDEARTQGGGLMGMISQAEKSSFHSDAILKELSANKNLTSGDLIVMQAMVYKAAQSTEVLSKVVDQVTGSVKTILSTNV